MAVPEEPITVTGKKPSDTITSGGQYGTLFDDYNLDPRMYFSADDLANLTDANGDPILLTPQEMTSDLSKNKAITIAKDIGKGAISVVPGVGTVLNIGGKLLTLGKDILGSTPSINQKLLDANTQAALNAIGAQSQQDINNSLNIANSESGLFPDLSANADAGFTSTGIPWLDNAASGEIYDPKNPDYSRGAPTNIPTADRGNAPGWGTNAGADTGNAGTTPTDYGITVTGKSPTANVGDTSAISTDGYVAPSTETTYDPATNEITVTGKKATPNISDTSSISLDGYTSGAGSTETTYDPVTNEITVTGTKTKPKTGDTLPITGDGYTPGAGSTETTYDPVANEITVTGTKTKPKTGDTGSITTDGYTSPGVDVTYHEPATSTGSTTGSTSGKTSSGTSTSTGTTGATIGDTSGGAGGGTTVTDGTSTTTSTTPSLAYKPGSFGYSDKWQFPTEYTPLHQFNVPNYQNVYDILFQGQGAQSPLGQSMLGTVPQTNMVDAALAAIAPQQAAQQAVDVAAPVAQSSTGKAHGGSVNSVIDGIIAYLHHIRR